MSYSKKRSFGERKNNARYRGNKSSRNGRKKQSINPSRFVNKNVKEKTIDLAQGVKHKFTDFNFTEKLENNLASAGLVTPSPIQDKTIPLAMNGADVIGLANTGTGKTAAFLLPVLEQLQ